MSAEIEPNDWASLDEWWLSFTETASALKGSALMRTVATERVINSWEELDSWWEIYTATGHTTAVEINELLDTSTAEWRTSKGPFDTDPLAANMARSRDQRGPLQPSNEEEWSDWLAQLLRPSGALVAELFGKRMGSSPDEVVREDRLLKDGNSHRRPDILIHSPDRGISIEVKLDDSHYEKTEETARLIERDYPNQEWTHTLLLPKRNIGTLRSNVEARVSSPSEEGLQVEWEDPGPISIIYWSDVTAAIRSLLHGGETVDDHWAANAYLFCAVAEQEILNFQPQPVIERLAAPANVVETVRPIRFADVLEEQLMYLQEMTNHG